MVLCVYPAGTGLNGFAGRRLPPESVHVVVVGEGQADYHLWSSPGTLDDICQNTHPLLLAHRVGSLQGVAAACSLRHVQHERRGGAIHAFWDIVVHPVALVGGAQNQLTQWECRLYASGAWEEERETKQTHCSLNTCL